MKTIRYVFFGIIAALGSLAAELALTFVFSAETLFLSERVTLLLVLLVVTEELFKFSVIYKSVSAESFLPPSFLASLGFALTEIGLAYFNYAQAGLLAPLSGILLVHILTGIMLGYAVWKYKKTGRKALLPIMLFFAAILHLAYNVAIVKSG